MTDRGVGLARPDMGRPPIRSLARWVPTLVGASLLAAILLGNPTATPPVSAITGLSMRVSANVTYARPNQVTKWTITATPSGTVKDAGFFIELSSSFAHYAGCSSGCVVNGFDATWHFASLKTKKTVTVNIQMVGPGSYGPIVGRVYLTDGACITGCPASDTVQLVPEDWAPKPTARPKPKPTPRPTPKPTARPTARPTPRPTPRPAATSSAQAVAAPSGSSSPSPTATSSRSSAHKAAASAALAVVSPGPLATGGAVADRFNDPTVPVQAAALGIGLLGLAAVAGWIGIARRRGS